MFKKLLKEKKKFVSPMNGQVIDMKLINDEVFSQNMIGEGIAVKYEGGKVVSPVSGKITATVPSGHAVGIETEDGMEILLHIGVDTVYLKDNEFTILKSIGEFVEQGEEIIKVDQSVLEKELDLSTPIIIVNYEKFNLKFKAKVSDKITSGESVIIEYSCK